ncbi:uncharacterized protein LOC126674084 [Mercurialis annua]|uniref:uncharacterized protein LOC126674084 n=1 Tax=Mercurialis annua TaxID=3986 RepID=UPI00215E7C8D|nr:uncharacterized protein LOC126674084 [Mercurialis annua]
MENNQVLMMKNKLEFLGIIKESSKIIFKNPKFIIFILLTSSPYFCTLLLLQVNFHQALLHSLKSKLTTLFDDHHQTEPTHGHLHFYSPPTTTEVFFEIFQNVIPPFILPALFYSTISHLVYLFTTIYAVYLTSMVYSQEEDHEPVEFKKILHRPFKKVGFKGPLVTLIYVVVLTSLTWIGIISLSTHFIILNHLSNTILKAVFGLAILALLMKYIEWSCIWSMGMVISILEEKHGDVALGVSAYISRGRRKCGFLVMLVFFVWWVVLRLMGVYGMWSGKSRNWVMVCGGEIFLGWLGNVGNWIVVTVYYYDCKKRFLEKKIDVEQGFEAVKL